MVLERRTLIVRSPHWTIIANHGMWTKLKTLFNFKGAVAQLGERRTCTAKVAGSNPVSSTMHGKAILPHSPKVIVPRGGIACS